MCQNRVVNVLLAPRIPFQGKYLSDLDMRRPRLLQGKIGYRVDRIVRRLLTVYRVGSLKLGVRTIKRRSRVC
jgi:hypothetical protein